MTQIQTGDGRIVQQIFTQDNRTVEVSGKDANLRDLVFVTARCSPSPHRGRSWWTHCRPAWLGSGCIASSAAATREAAARLLQAGPMAEFPGR